MIFREYRNILGEPKKGFHEQTLFGVAIYDLIGTFIIAIILSIITGYPVIKSFLYLFITGQFLHILFGVNTRFLNMIGISFE